MPWGNIWRGIKDGCGQTEIEPNSPLPPNHTASQITSSAANSEVLRCAGLGIWHMACVSACVCASRSVCLHIIVRRQEREREREAEKEREREGKDDLGVMRAGKIMVPSGIMGLNLIC